MSELTKEAIEQLVNKENIRARVSSNFNYIRGQLDKNTTDMAALLNTTRQNYEAIEAGKSMAIDNIIRMSFFAKVSLETLLLTDMNEGGEKYTRAVGRPSGKKENPQLP